ncbi:MAG: spermidine synthase [Beijerinckiaceae bacterium]
MIPWQHLDITTIPGGGELRLKRRGAEFSISLGQIELMNSRLSGSEEALATLTAEKLGARRSPQVLVGGLGMGFTLRAALGCFDADARIVVAELVPSVVAWARGPMAELFAGSMDDPRVEVRVEDVGGVIREARAAYDAILLDVDNGPDGLTVAGNDRLYDARGLAAATAALRPGGVLAVWSAYRDDAFAARLRRAGFAVEEKTVRAHRGKKGARHTIWLAARS